MGAQQQILISYSSGIPVPTYTLKSSVNAFSALSNSTVTSSGINTTGANLIVVNVATSGQATGTFTDSLSNTWTLQTNAIIGSGDAGARLLQYYCINPTVGASQTFTYTVGGSANGYPVINAYSFAKTTVISGTPTTTTPIFDKNTSNTSSATGTTIQPGSITPVVSGELLVTAYSNDVNGGTGTINLSYNTPIGSGGSGHSVQSFASYILAASISALNPTWSGLTVGAGSNAAAGHISFK